MSQPGVLHVEVHFPEGTGILIYDGTVTSARELAKSITEKIQGKYPTTVKFDQVLR